MPPVADEELVVQADGLGLLSDEHFTVDGTLIEAAASLRPKNAPPESTPPDDPGNPSINVWGERRCSATHGSTTDPEARLARKDSMCSNSPDGSRRSST